MTKVKRVRRGNLVYLVGGDQVFGAEGRLVGKVSPKYPDESASEKYYRLYLNVPDDVPVSQVVGTKLKAKKTLADLHDPEAPKEYPDDKCPVARSATGMRWVVAPAGDPPVGFQGKKWKELKAWGDLCIQEFASNKKYLPVSALARWAMIEYGAEAARRVVSIYRNDVEKERQLAAAWASFQSMPASQDPGRPRVPRADKPQGVDRYGVRLGSAAARINAVLSTKPKTGEEIMKEAKADRWSHLTHMVKLGHLVKTKDGKYKLVEKS